MRIGPIDGPAMRERGAAVTGVVIVVCFAVVVLLFVTVLPIAGRTQHSDLTESAADAAALAAADRVRELVRDGLPTLGPGDTLDGLLPLSAGISEASAYANRNGADLVGSAYSLDRYAGRVDVQVARRNERDGRRTERASAAEVGVVLGSCGIEDRRVIVGYEPVPTPSPTPTPTPSPGETPTPTPSPTPPPPPVPIYGFEYRFVCTDVDGADLRSPWTRVLDDAVDAGRGWVTSRLDVRLVR
ncbi:hypothetical protein [Cellulomonas sp. S1-8]|uniref:hypothetical protein n=1 Tax=Cellulomonas sp. S1-8 TaxID=2904790 RepID=UPI0022442F4D|nr:hypothetical protein [Cellulomonas sp. S1-8]UZN02154.1 hypothetical protein OKX07_13795 [Cellulomonas sp. S1-8]